MRGCVFEWFKNLFFLFTSWLDKWSKLFTAVVYIKMSDQMLTLTSRVHDDVDYHRDQLSERKQIALYKQLDSYGSTGSKKVSIWWFALRNCFLVLLNLLEWCKYNTTGVKGSSIMMACVLFFKSISCARVGARRSQSSFLYAVHEPAGTIYI